MQFELPLCINYQNKDQNSNQLQFFECAFNEQINQYGVGIDYIVKNYSMDSHNYQKGEDPTNPYDPPIRIKMMLNITNDAVTLAKYGIVADSDLVAQVSIMEFHETFGDANKPKPGDLMKLTEFGQDRPNGLDGPIFEVTEVLDEFLDGQNILQGHYIWQLKAKRFQYSFEPGVTPEAKNGPQLMDNGGFGLLPGYTSSVSSVITPLSGSQTEDLEALKNFNYIDNQTQTQVYGQYVNPSEVPAWDVTKIRYWALTNVGRLTQQTVYILDNKLQIKTNQHIFGVNAKNQYIYYAINPTYTPTFYVNNVLSAFMYETLIIDNNAYNVYRSPVKLNGSNTIKVLT